MCVCVCVGGGERRMASAWLRKLIKHLSSRERSKTHTHTHARRPRKKPRHNIGHREIKFCCTRVWNVERASASYWSVLCMLDERTSYLRDCPRVTKRKLTRAQQQKNNLGTQFDKKKEGERTSASGSWNRMESQAIARRQILCARA